MCSLAERWSVDQSKVDSSSDRGWSGELRVVFRGQRHSILDGYFSQPNGHFGDGRLVVDIKMMNWVEALTVEVEARLRLGSFRDATRGCPATRSYILQAPQLPQQVRTENRDLVLRKLVCFNLSPPLQSSTFPKDLFSSFGRLWPDPGPISQNVHSILPETNSEVRGAVLVSRSSITD